MVSKLNCCTHLWRIIFLIINLFFCLIGLALIGLGIYLLVSGNDLSFITGNQIASGATLILISGIVTCIIALVGVIGAAGMWHWVLAFYIVFMFLVIILEIVAGVLGFVFQNELGIFVQDSFTRAIDDFEPNVENNVTRFVNFFQGQIQCCGFDSFEDWLDTPFFNQTQMFPDSCNCTENNSSMATSCTVANEVPHQMIYDRNCSFAVRTFLIENLAVIGGVGIAFGVIEILGLVISIGLCICFCYIKKHKEDFDFDKAL